MIPVDVMKFILKKIGKNAEELQQWADGFLDTDSVGMYYVDRIVEHCDDLSDVLKELIP